MSDQWRLSLHMAILKNAMERSWGGDLKPRIDQRTSRDDFKFSSIYFCPRILLEGRIALRINHL